MSANAPGDVHNAGIASGWDFQSAKLGRLDKRARPRTIFLNFAQASLHIVDQLLRKIKPLYRRDLSAHKAAIYAAFMQFSEN